MTERVIIVRASLRFVWRELTDRVIIIMEFFCTQKTHRSHALSGHQRRVSFFHSSSLQVFQDPLRCSNSADGIVARLFQACSN